jgi:site-specific recombinase XerD
LHGYCGRLRRLERENPASPFVFVSERGSPFTEAGFARMLERAAVTAGLELKVHPHTLHDACGYAIANKGPRKPRVARASVYYQHGRLYGAGAEPV